MHYYAHTTDDTQKPWQPLISHLMAAADDAGDFGDEVGLGSAGSLMGLVHDLGKYTEKFQSYLKGEEGKGGDHSSPGAQWIWRKLYQKGPIGSLCAQLLAIGVCSHHAPLNDCLSKDGETDLFTLRMEKDEAVDELLKVVDKEVLDRAIPLLSTKTMAELKAHLLSIKRKNDEESSRTGACQACTSCPIQCAAQNPLTAFQFGLVARFLYSCIIDADRTDTAAFCRPSGASRKKVPYVDWPLLLDRYEAHLAGFKETTAIDGIRNQVSALCRERAEAGKGIFTLTVPTGGGKTLASLRFALHHAQRHAMKRIIYIIPYTSIIDQNAQEIRSILEKDEPFGSVVLEHHSNLVPEKQTQLSMQLTENWDAPIVFTTMVQFLEALFGSRTRDARRMHRLAESVLVFDEIQTLPVKCVHLFCNALNYLVNHCGTSAVLCTATQPLLGKLDNPQKGSLNLSPETEIVPDITALFKQLKRVEIVDLTKPGGWTAEEIAAKAIEEFEAKGSCLVIVNTKKWAKMLYALCADQGIPKDALFHLSTDMCPAHRMKSLSAIRERLGNKPVLCISTQLIEAGVDVSFGSVIRFAAGMDSIHQAAGRCNRHMEGAMAQVFIVDPCDESISMLPDIIEGKKVTLRILEEFKKNPGMYGGDLLSPSVIETYFHYYFFKRQLEMDYPVSDSNAGGEDTLFNMLSCNRLKSGNMCFDPMLRQSFASASRAFNPIESEAQGILVPYRDETKPGNEGKRIIGELCAAFEPKAQRDLLRMAQRYSVNVFPHVLRKLNDKNAIMEIQDTGIFYLDERYYSDEFGLSTEASMPMGVSIF